MQSHPSSSSSLLMDPRTPATLFKTTLFSNTHLTHAFFLTMLLFSPSSSVNDLSLDFYASSCPNVEILVRDTVRSAATFDPTIPGKLLRLLFHDCMVEGCDASVLLQGNGTERSDPANKSLGGFQVVDSAKRLLELLCPGAVSCADILVIVARDAVELAGGPFVQVATGRRDGRVSSSSNVRPNTVDTSFTLDEMLQLFNTKGLSLDDLVTLSGAHTIGSAHCSAFSDRFKVNSKGELKPIDESSMDKSYAAELAKQCPAGASASSSITVNNDPETSSSFDNQYYRNLLLGKGLFQSDSVLVKDSRTREKVEALSSSQESFFASWERSFLKLTSVGVKTGDEGEIRASCIEVNR